LPVFDPGSGYTKSLANGCLQGIFIWGTEEGEKEGRRRIGEEREKKRGCAHRECIL